MAEVAGSEWSTVVSEVLGYIRKHDPSPKRETSLSLLRRRELCTSGRAYSITERIGFEPDAIRHYSKFDAYWHNGCINTANWSDDGMLLVTGSDDRIVKVWREGCYQSGDGELVVRPDPLYQVRTQHHANIFCAKFQPGSGNRVVYSCAADGTLGRHDLDRDSTSVLVQPYDDVAWFSSAMLHMFEFDRDNPNILYLAAEEGSVTILDTRAPADSHSRATHLRIGAGVKYVCQFPPEVAQHRLAVGAMQPEILQVDLRALSESDGSMRLERVYCPKQLEKAPTQRSLSISGLAFSSDGSRLLASYQGDQIYEFPTNAEANTGYVDAIRSFGGHVNYETFLKNVSYFGPHDEYVVSGSDRGAAMVWSTSDRSLVVALHADSRVCNGVVPHPFYPMFVTYGIDNTASAWWFEQREQDAPRKFNSRSLWSNRQSDDVTYATMLNSTKWQADTCHHIVRGDFGRHPPAMYDLENYARNAAHIRRRFAVTQASCINRAHRALHPEGHDSFLVVGFPDFPFDYEGTDFERVARLCKECGSAHFKAGRYAFALQQYIIALHYATYAIYALGKKKLDHFMRDEMVEEEGLLGEVLSLPENDIAYSPNFEAADVCSTCVCPVPWDFRNGPFDMLVETVERCFDTCYCDGLCGCQSPKQELTAIRLNICATYLALQEYRAAISATSRLLLRERKEPKAYFRRGCAHFELREYDAALADFNKALELAPNDAGIQRKIAQVRRALAQRTQKQARALARAFSSPNGGDDQT